MFCVCRPQALRDRYKVTAEKLKVKMMNDVELALRKLLWIRHGCTIGLYGNDGKF